MNNTTIELCPNCENEVEISTDKVSNCPKCNNKILPCSMCNMDEVNCNKCKYETMINNFDEDKVSGTWLQIDTYDDKNNCIIKQFEVPRWWLQKQVEEEYKTVNNFLDEYTSDESIPIYAQAIIENMILCEINR